MALTDKLTAVADAIRGKTGKAEPMTLDQMAVEISGITGGGGGIEPTATYLTAWEMSHTIMAYPLVPKYKNELIVWNTTGENKAGSGSVTPYAFLAWIINGVPFSECAWIVGAAKTAPWEDEAYGPNRRTAQFTLDENGVLTVPIATWGYHGENNTCTVYEIPLPIGLGV